MSSMVPAKPYIFVLLLCHVDLLAQLDLPNQILYHLVSTFTWQWLLFSTEYQA